MLMLVLLVEGQTALTLECNRGRLTPPLQMGLVLPVGQGGGSLCSSRTWFGPLRQSPRKPTTTHGPEVSFTLRTRVPHPSSSIACISSRSHTRTGHCDQYLANAPVTLC